MEIRVRKIIRLGNAVEAVKAPSGMLADRAVATPALLSSASALDAGARLLGVEALLLDRHRFREWLELFDQNAVYWVPISAAAQDPVGTLNIVYADYPMLSDRVYRIETGEAHAQDPLSKTVHLLGMPLVTDVSDEGRWFSLATPFVVAELRREVRSFAGRYLHRVKDVDGVLKIAYKKVELLESEEPLPNLTLFL